MKWLVRLFLVVSIIGVDLFGQQTAIQIIFDNKGIINDYIQNCYIDGNERKKKCFIYEGDFFTENIEQPIAFWQSNENRFFNVFLSLCSRSEYIQKDCSYVINNDLFVQILANMLSVKNSQCAADALNFLVTETSMRMIEKWSHNIRKNLLIANLMSNDKLKLYALLSLEKPERDSVIKIENLPFLIQARLGDTLLQMEFYSKYQNATTFFKKKTALHDLFYIGTSELITKILKDFNAPYYDTVSKTKTDTCIAESIRYPIIKELRRFYPEERLFNTELDKLSSLGHSYNKNMQKKILNYFDEINKWIKKTYRIEPDPLPVLPLLREKCIKK